MALATNSPDQLANHFRITQGKVRTRFPPEPNGYLHVGHAKSMHMNFFEAFEKLRVPLEQRETFFRYDDTNPEAESSEYIAAIAQNVRWLGYSPTQVTYSSQYFQELYDLALQLIKKGKAYVCHQSKAEIEASRIVLQQFHATPGVKHEQDVADAGKSPFRSRSIAENVAEFEKMQWGEYGEGEACLRMKMDLGSPNPNMWDQVAYRIKFVPHPHVGDQWCIYPTYDYTHCIVDALEHIDYSICTLEFETRRESYYWLLHELNLFKPKVYEFARLSMTYTVLSKRKLLKLVMSNAVRGWDDPRMSTLNGLRRRGFTPEIIKQFCKEIGVTRVQSTIQIERLYSVARSILGDSSKRVMAVLDPIELIIENFSEAPDKSTLLVRVPDYPQDVDRNCGQAYHHVQLTPKLFLDRSDVHTEDSSDFFGVAPNKQVRLKYAFPFTCTKLETDASGRVTKVLGQMDWTSEAKSKGVLSWVPSNSPEVEVRVYSHLFTVPELPSDVEDWESLVDSKNSERVYTSARIDPESHAKNLDGIVQFERIGYFVSDKDSTKEKLVFNQIVALRDSGGETPGSAPSSGASTASRKDAQKQQLALKMEKMKVAPADMFKKQPELYAHFDAEGLPTHNAAGEELTKSQRKKLKKEQEKQKKLYEGYLAKEKTVTSTSTM
uniref:glutamine--tRNA ligase n=1 Tax=Hyaloperonospora arabidopsidis (strain Emoy2) TaxID=559515 RepID=M4BBL4_HYAAE